MVRGGFYFRLIGFILLAALCTIPPMPAQVVGDGVDASNSAWRIRRIRLESTTPLSPHEQEHVADEIRRAVNQSANLTRCESGISCDGKAGGFGAEFVRQAYQDRGYLKAIVFDPTVRAGSDIAGQYLDITFKIEPGIQYRLGEIHWKGEAVFSEAQLNARMPIHPGEIFGRGETASGIDAVRKLYNSRAYLDFVLIPNIRVDDRSHEISLQMDVDEGEEFRWGNLDVFGMQDRDQAALLRAWEKMRGQKYSSQDFTRFFEKRFRPMRAGIRPDDYTWKQTNRADHTVDVILNLWQDPALVSAARGVR